MQILKKIFFCDFAKAIVVGVDFNDANLLL
jgi:hypothetical protein